MIKRIFSIFFLLIPVFVHSSSDSIQGKLTPLRTCFDVNHYDISVKTEPGKKYISGKNSISFTVISALDSMQLDLSKNMTVEKVLFNNREIHFKRQKNTFIVVPGEILPAGSRQVITVFFSGKPQVAKLPPWQGGFVWSKDSSNHNWIGLACESTGASVWLPCKDHWSDEADSMDMHLSVPGKLTGVSNGRQVNVSAEANGFRTFHWQVKNSINNYNISINAGRYAEIRDTFYGINTVPLSYYVLEYNKEKAEKHFLQVKTMLSCFERYFGAYPFFEDGYKLVETPYWGMEHQSCIAYGNNYKNNDFGFDFIIIHESGHEWFANSITAKDPADMWIHESFTTYSEALFVECTMGFKEALDYLELQRSKIVSRFPMQGPRDVFFHDRTDSDIYYKGTWMLHTMRHVLNNDSIWFAVLKDFSTRFKHQVISTEEVIGYFNTHTVYNWDVFFKQYLYGTGIPVFQYKLLKREDGKMYLLYQWQNTLDDFTLPVRVYVNGQDYVTVTPSNQEQEITIAVSPEKPAVRVATEFLLIDVKTMTE